MYTRVIRLYPAPVKTVKGIFWGYINKKGDFSINPKFGYAMDFQQNGLAVVEKNGRYGLINEFGKFIVQPDYYSISDFSEGRAIVSNSEGYHVIDEKGRLITTKPYQYIGVFQHSRAPFSVMKDNSYLYGYLDGTGKEVIPAQFKTANDFQNQTAIVQQKNNTYTLINQEGKTLQTYIYPFVGVQGDGLLAFKKKDTFDEKFGVMDLAGNIIIPPTYTGIMPFQNERAVVNTADNFQNQYGLIDKKGNYVIKPVYNDLIMLGEKRVAVGKALNKGEPYMGSVYAIGRIDGTFLSGFNFSTVSPFDKGVASLSDETRTFFITKSGKIETDLPVVKGEGILSVEGDIIKANIDQRLSYLTKDGKVIWESNTVIPLTWKYKLIEKKYKPNKNYLVYYPQVKRMVDKVAEQNVNRSLKNLSTLKELGDDEPLPYTYSGDFEVEYFKKDLLVLELNSYDYQLGAAHGMPSKVYTHINLVNGTMYELKHLFKPESDYVKVISAMIGEQINKDDEYSYVFPDAYKGISPDQSFYVSEEALFIYFSPYEIAPFAAGFPTFKIPYLEIENIINVDGDFWKSFH
jgi:hypothetical protein